MRDALQRAWLGRGPLACALWPVSMLFGAIAALHRRLYRWHILKSEAAGVPVVVIGNVVTGGAGKTPVVIALAQHFVRRGIRVGVVSRGHGRKSNGVVAVHPESDPQHTGDEPLLIAQRAQVPVFVAPRRIDAARALLGTHPATQIILCDDGLQHRALQRDLEVCVFDDRGIANGWLLPAGPLREHWPRPADLVLRTARTPAIQGYVTDRALAEYAVRADGSRVALASLRGQRCHAVAAIAQPERFFEMLRAAGLTLGSTLPLPDHHDFGATELPAADAGPLLCTEKDMVKLRALAPHAMAVPLEIQIESGFWRAIDSMVSAKLSSRDGSQTA